MGRDKALLEADGETLLDRARALLGDAGCGRVLIAGRPELPGGLPDLTPGAGPARAACDALLAMADAGLEIAVVVPVDMPLLTAKSLELLIAAAAAGAAAYERHPLPFCARLHAPTLEAAEPESMRDLLKALSVIWFPLDGLDARIFTNVNTPDDWRRLVGKDL
jgi:molybdopterin-guanine dinucleotide biosynthesis protein A